MPDTGLHNRSTAPVVFDPALDAYRVTRDETVRAVAADPARFSSRPWVTGDATTVLAESDGAEHKRLRDIWLRVLHRARVDRLRPRIAERAVALAAGLADRGRADLVADFAQPLAESVIDELVDDAFPLLATVDDLPGTPLTPADRTSMIRQLHAAGVDTTCRAITGTVHAMLTESLWDKAIADRGIIPDAVEETLRRDSPHRGVPRTTTEDVVLGGVALPAGSRLLLEFGSANRDERRFTDPDSFELHRENVREHVAFGHGPHACLGAYLARTEARVAVEVLTRRLPKLALADGHEPSHAGSFSFRGLERLDVTW